MEDRELLERAAAAAGIKLQWPVAWGGKMSLFDISDEENHKLWNPLSDDGDAFRLAVKMSFQVLIVQGPDGDITWVRAPEELDIEGPSERHGTDACAATRRAIVRAAALID